MGKTNRTRTPTTTLVPVGDRLMSTTSAAKYEGGDLDPQPFKPIGLGKPLLVVIEWCYLGDFRGPRQKAPLLMASTVKDLSQFSGQPRAVNFASDKHSEQSPIAWPAYADGSRIVYYSDAMDKTRFDFTIELATDQFNKPFADALAELMGKAGALPVFSVGAQAALVAGSQIFKLANSVADGVLDGDAYYDVTDTIAFDVAGHRMPQAGIRYLFRSSDAAEAKRILAPSNTPGDFQLYQNGEEYRGNIPYVTITLDGRKNQNLSAWKATAATSDHLSQFLKGVGSDKVQIVTEIAGGLKFYSDYQTGTRIRDAQASLKKLDKNTQEYRDLAARIAAMKDQLQTDEFKKIFT